jgi:hypothetical protein
VESCSGHQNMVACKAGGVLMRFTSCLGLGYGRTSGGARVSFLVILGLS